MKILIKTKMIANQKRKPQNPNGQRHVVIKAEDQQHKADQRMASGEHFVARNQALSLFAPMVRGLCQELATG